MNKNKEPDIQFNHVSLFPDDNFLTFVEWNPSTQKLHVVHALSYKNIVQTDQVRENGKYSIGTSNILELRFVRNREQYEKYILAKWAKYKASIGQNVENELHQDPGEFV